MTGAQIAAAWAAVANAVESGARFPPPNLGGIDWDAVAAGAVTHVEANERRVVAVGRIGASREAVWLAITDDRMSENVESLTEVALAGAWANPKTLYQRLDLPWPFHDRHWVIVSKNADAAGVWERYWEIDADALPGARSRTDAAAFDAAEPVVVNDGNWLLLALDTSDTFAVYQARVRLGGSLPDGAVESFTRGQVEGMFAGIAKGAAGMKHRYGPGCVTQPGADGVGIPCFARPQ